MARYVIFDPPRGARADAQPVFVRDGFAWLGFVLPPLWLAWHRLWLEAALVVVAMIGVSMAKGWLGAPLLGLLTTLIALYVGLEGPGLRLAGLRRRGFRETGVANAPHLGEAELRYTARAEDETDEPVRSVAPGIGGRDASTLGLLTVPGRR